MPDPTGRVSHLPEMHREQGWKQPVRVATTANGTLSTAFANGQTVDGVTLATGDRILLKGQSTGSQNGIYTVNASGAPTRAYDMDQDGTTAVPAQEVMGAIVYVIAGTANGGTFWRTTNTTAPTLGTTTITWAQFASSGTTLGWYDMKVNGGLVGDGTTDDTAAFQAAITAATASGTQSATLYFPAGTYLIGGALQDTGAFNGQILLPNVSTSSAQITITFKGAARPPLAVHGPIPTPNGYSILKSSLTGASGTAAVVSGGNGGYPTQTNVQVVLEDLVCLAPSNPTMTWWNLSCTQGGRTTGVYVSTTTDWVGTRVEPTNSNAYGIKLPGYGESNYVYVDGLVVSAFYTGILQGELSVLRGIVVNFCIVGVELGYTAGHASLIVSMHQTSCTYGIKVTTATWCDVLQYDAEHSSSPAWATTVYDVNDGSNLLHGRLTWFGVATGGSPDHAFSINGGSNVRYAEIGAVPAGAATASGLTMATARLLGRTTAATGAIEEITVGSGLSLSAGALTATGVSAGLVFLETHTASTSATLDFTTFYSSTYDEYVIEFVNVIPATNNAVLWMRMSTNGGSSYDTSAIYDYTSGFAYSGGTGVGSSATNSTKLLLMDATSNSANYGIVGSVRLFSPGSTALYKTVVGTVMRSDGNGLGLVLLNAMGSYKSATAVNAVRFLMDTGNITSGTIRIYGVTKS